MGVTLARTDISSAFLEVPARLTASNSPRKALNAAPYYRRDLHTAESLFKAALNLLTYRLITVRKVVCHNTPTGPSIPHQNTTLSRYTVQDATSRVYISLSEIGCLQVKVWLGEGMNHYYVLSRFLISRMLTVTKIPCMKVSLSDLAYSSSAPDAARPTL